MKLELRNVERLKEGKYYDYPGFKADVRIDGKAAGKFFYEHDENGNPNSRFALENITMNKFVYTQIYHASLPPQKLEADFVEPQQLAPSIYNSALHIGLPIAIRDRSLEFLNKIMADQETQIIVGNIDRGSQGFDMGIPILQLIKADSGMRELNNVLGIFKTELVGTALEDKVYLLNTNLPEAVVKNCGIRTDYFFRELLEDNAKRKAKAAKQSKRNITKKKP